MIAAAETRNVERNRNRTMASLSAPVSEEQNELRRFGGL